MEGCQGRETTHFPMARGNSYEKAVWLGREGRTGRRKESTEIFLKEGF